MLATQVLAPLQGAIMSAWNSGGSGRTATSTDRLPSDSPSGAERRSKTEIERKHSGLKARPHKAQGFNPGVNRNTPCGLKVRARRWFLSIPATHDREPTSDLRFKELHSNFSP